MFTITNFDKRTTKTLQEASVEALQEVARRYGVEVCQHGGSIDTGEVTLKFKFKVTDPAAKEAAERGKFEMYAPSFGLKAAHYGARFFSGRDREAYTLVGFEPKRSRYPLRGRRVRDGKEMLFTEVVLMQIHKGDVLAEASDELRRGNLRVV
jgi:hypothetical protein